MIMIRKKKSIIHAEKTVGKKATINETVINLRMMTIVYLFVYLIIIE